MEDQTQHKDHTFKGIAYGIAAFFLFAVMSAAAKLLTDTHSIFEIAFYRSLIAVTPFTIYIIVTRNTQILHVKRPFILLLRVIIGLVGLLFTFSAMKYLPMSNATLIFLTSTLITPVLAFFILKERMGWRRWAAIIFALCGVVLVAQPDGQELVLFGLLCAFIAAFCHSSTQIALRTLKEESSVAITFYFLIGGAIIMAPFMIHNAGSFETAQDIGLIVLVSAAAALGQLCLSHALKFAPANSISPFNFSGLLWATLFDIMIWSYIPGWPVFAGASMMLAAKIYILHRERIHAKQKP